jgi:hypothetical protein
MVNSIAEIGNASVYAPDAPYILYMILLAVNVETYIVRAAFDLAPAEAAAGSVSGRSFPVDELKAYRMQFRKFLHGVALEILETWREEAEGFEDIPTASVVHAYVAIVWSNTRADEYTAENVAAMVGSMAYVRNWHGFGLGSERSDLLASGDPEERLMRFLQAQGIDTTDVAAGSLEQFMKGRPMWLNVGHECIKVPTIRKRKEGVDGEVERLPPTDMPAYRVFAVLQQHRRSLVTFMDATPSEETSATLQALLRIALRSADFTAKAFVQVGAATGRWNASGLDLTVDLQTCEIMWRNDELKPVPDSMVQYGDFEQLFGREALHCGIVARQQHRHWVHVVRSHLYARAV